MKKKLVQLLFAMVLFVPFTASAHVKWFVDTEELLPQELDAFSITEPAVLAWIAIVISITAVAVVLDTRLRVLPWVIEFGKKQKEAILWVVHWFVGGWLIATFFQGALFVPPFIAETPFADILLWVQLGLGVLLMTRRFNQLAGITLALLYLGASIEFGWLNMIEHLFILGFAYLFFREHHDRRKQFDHTWSLALIRLTAGISLIILGLQEKILHPILVTEFLETHPWNFMQILGFEWFDDRLFILSGGMTEMLFGILYVIGVVTRINTLAFAGFLITTAIVLGPKEILGHLPIFAAALLFLVYGSGSKLHIPSMLRANKRK